MLPYLRSATKLKLSKIVLASRRVTMGFIPYFLTMQLLQVFCFSSIDIKAPSTWPKFP